MPFTDSPSTIVRDDPRAAAIAAAARDDSYDARQHSAASIKFTCTDCDAVINERCADERYPSGRPMRYARTPHAARVALAAAAAAAQRAEREQREADMQAARELAAEMTDKMMREALADPLVMPELKIVITCLYALTHEK